MIPSIDIDNSKINFRKKLSHQNRRLFPNVIFIFPYEHIRNSSDVTHKKLNKNY